MQRDESKEPLNSNTEESHDLRRRFEVREELSEQKFVALMERIRTLSENIDRRFADLSVEMKKGFEETQAILRSSCAGAESAEPH